MPAAAGSQVNVQSFGLYVGKSSAQASVVACVDCHIPLRPVQITGVIDDRCTQDSVLQSVSWFQSPR
jgi:hypothetical protein